MSGHKIGLKQIAQLANVDVSTVSRALSGGDRVSPKTRQNILDIADRINYKPNALARSLVVGKTQTVGIVLPEISNMFYSGVISSIEKVLASEGYSFILCLSHYDREMEIKCFGLLESKRVDGVIILSGCSNDTSNALFDYERLGIPCVVMDYGVDVQSADVVASNHIVGIKLGVEYLISQGHKRIAFVTDDVTTNERLDAFKVYMREQGLDAGDLIVRSSVKYEKGGYQAVMKLFSAAVKPTAVFCANDYMAIGAMKALFEMNLRVPEDVSVMGFDDSELLNYLQCPLTTIRQHKHRLGEEAARLLVRRMIERDGREAKEPYANVTLRPDIVIRGSTGPCPEK